MWCDKVLEKMEQEQIEKEQLNSIFIVVDVRHHFEVKYFLSICQQKGIPLLLVRLEALQETREKRGWVQSEIDANVTEVDLDEFQGIHDSFRC